jgi:hypothetical protein
MLEWDNQIKKKREKVRGRKRSPAACGVFAAHLGGISGGDRVLLLCRLVVQAYVGPRSIIPFFSNNQFIRLLWLELLFLLKSTFK